MLTDANAEVVRLRAALRDLVALYAIPAAWVGREPLTVAEGLADTLIELLQLKCVAVRLYDPGAGEPVEAMRGDARTCSEWLRNHLSESRPVSSTEIISDGGGSGSWRGVLIPVGVDAAGGVVAAVSERTNFPSEVDQLLLHLAANQAATAFQNACLIHERERAEEQLRTIQRLSVMEEERGRIAREIHDDALQSLGAVTLRLSLLAERLTNEDQRRSITVLLDLTRQSAERLRTLVFDLRADALQRGLVHALRSYVFEAPNSLPVPCRIDCRLRAEPPVPVGVVLYRVAQEALTNVRKHARASSARLLLDEAPGGVRLRVVDDGRGFDLSGGTEAPGHLGLAAMRERAELAGGRLSVESAPGRGTTVEVWVPMPDGT